MGLTVLLALPVAPPHSGHVDGAQLETGTEDLLGSPRFCQSLQKGAVFPKGAPPL